ncbi:DUF4157 domain-containing protein [Lentzea sp. NPDC058450]|uniref:eCIS core domain-containing protein n=1 Tax=Lentzea sp. NPDC058450 TaxID=3346505 RepID=UPI0036580762
MPDPHRTLGEQLAEQVRALTRRRTAAPAWHEAALTATARAAELARSARIGRERVEVAVPDEVEPLTLTEPEWPAHQEEPGTRHDLPGDVTRRLRAVVGPDLPPVRVRTGPAADAVAWAHDADAVTTGDEILFRDGRFAPAEPEGFALLVHEAWHVRQNSTAASWDRATTAGRAAEEHQAHRHERAALEGARLHAVPASADRTTVPGREPASLAVSPHTAATPMTAATGRTIEPETTPAAAPDVAELSETIYRDLVRRIRSDVERGG